MGCCGMYGRREAYLLNEKVVYLCNTYMCTYIDILKLALLVRQSFSLFQDIKPKQTTNSIHLYTN